MALPSAVTVHTVRVPLLSSSPARASDGAPTSSRSAAAMAAFPICRGVIVYILLFTVRGRQR